MPKQKLTLSIDKEVITQAKKQQINLSSFLEIRLSEYLCDKESGRGGIRTRDIWLRRPAPYPG
jgi:predicted DNA-binding ribbon-helix-helix protein